MFLEYQLTYLNGISEVLLLFTPVRAMNNEPIKPEVKKAGLYLSIWYACVLHQEIISHVLVTL